MSFASNLLAAIQAIGTDIKALVNGKQDALVSGTNIKTINGTSLLGAGNVLVSGGSGGGASYVMASFPGYVGVLESKPRWSPPTSITLSNVALQVNQAPTVALVLDILKNGASTFSGSKPTIAVGEYSASLSIVDVTVLPTDYLQLNIVSGNGADLTARIDYS